MQGNSSASILSFGSGLGFLALERLAELT